MLRSWFCMVLIIRLLGVFWSAFSGLLIILGGISLLQYFWQLLLVVTAP